MIEGRRYYLNLNYVCNERCVFCAADMTNDVQRAKEKGYSIWLGLDAIRARFEARPPRPQDRIMLAGGEPTLSKDLFEIVRYLSRDCKDVTLFTNGLKLADREYARQAVESGINRFQVAFFGATAERHDAVTQVQGSFERTLTALNELAELRRSGHDLTISVRVLFSRQSSAENPAIVRMVRERAPGITQISLNRLILSKHAERVNATISWAEARPSINETMSLARTSGYDVDFWAIPLCAFDEENAAFVRAHVLKRHADVTSGRTPARWEMLYLDPVVAAGEDSGELPGANMMLEPCMACDYVRYCGRVEGWYIQKYGGEGLVRIRLSPERPSPAASAAAPRSPA